MTEHEEGAFPLMAWTARRLERAGVVITDPIAALLFETIRWASGDGPTDRAYLDFAIRQAVLRYEELLENSGMDQRGDWRRGEDG